jgi:DNA polymerase type B, organellar and viral
MDLRFNNISLFNNPNLLIIFKQYSLQDAIALYKALAIAQFTYFNLFKIDIESIYSTATLALKIFRSKFLDKPIFILPQYMDTFIRDAYYGGGTDVYKAWGENVHYYDVNSLYPSAMLQPMPYNLISPNLIDLTNRSLDSFFGFCKATIHCPTDMLRPVLPYHSNGKTIYPTGVWTGVYFSEELKAVVKLGYQINLISGYEFTKADLFTKYVNTFYEIKRTKTGSEKAVAKLLLNNLYGYFGRKQINIITTNIKNEHIKSLLLSRVVKSINKINEQYSTVLSYSNINHKLLSQLNNHISHISLKELNSPIKSNVAIAAAVTAYARIHMIPFKIDPNTLYTDTDSMFTLTPIDPSLLGDALGFMKDEMKGKIIKEAIFLGPKQYGYWYLDENNNKIENSVFAGVPRNSLTFPEIVKINEGVTITKQIPNRFYKSFNTLNINIKDSSITIKKNNNKLLVDNQYLPININKGYHNSINKMFTYYKNLITKTIKYYYKSIK